MLELLIVLLIIGVVLWLITTVIPMDPRIRQIIIVLVVLFVVIWLLQAVFGGGRGLAGLSLDLD